MPMIACPFRTLVVLTLMLTFIIFPDMTNIWGTVSTFIYTPTPQKDDYAHGRSF